MKQLIWYLIAGTRGGETRAIIIKSILDEPKNANQLAKSLKLDYKTIRHHIDVLTKNSVIYAINKDNYGAVYFPTEIFEHNRTHFEEIWKRFGNKSGKPT